MSSSQSVTAWIGQVKAGDRCRHLLDRLSPELRSVALWKMEGFTNVEIAQRLGCVAGTVERKLRVIRKIWEKESPRE